MTSTRFYTIIYFVLFAFATLQVAVEYGFIEDMYWTAFGAIIVLSVIKAVLVAAYYQHLRDEPRSVTVLITMGLIGAILLTFAAAYSMV